MKFLDRLGELWLHWAHGVCLHAGLRSCQPEPAEQTSLPAGMLTQAILNRAFDELWKGGPIPSDIELWLSCPDHHVPMIRHEPSNDWACPMRPCRFYHGIKPYEAAQWQ